MRALGDALQTIQQEIQQRAILRWTLANIVGWSAGLLLGTQLVEWMVWLLGDVVGQMVGPLFAGLLIGFIVGWAQRWALRGVLSQSPQLQANWLKFSILGGVVGITTLVITWWPALLIGSPGYLVMGAVFGLAFGWMQTPALKEHLDELAVVWVVANMLGGGLCSFLTFTGVPFHLPVFCTFGPASFGIITGFALLVLARDSEGQ